MKTSLVIPMFALAVPLFAAAPASAQGTDAQRAACSGDAFRLCASAIPNVGRISACLRRERTQLSPACRDVVDAADGSGSGGVAAARTAPAQRVAATPRAIDAGPTVQAARISRQAAAGYTPRLATVTRVVVRRTPTTRTIIKYVYVNRPVARAGFRRAAYRSGRGGGQMAQAMYWMRKVGGMSGMGDLSGMAGGLGGNLGGMSMSSLMSMMPY